VRACVCVCVCVCVGCVYVMRDVCVCGIDSFLCALNDWLAKQKLTGPLLTSGFKRES
jgi:hypothetical protein